MTKSAIQAIVVVLLLVVLGGVFLLNQNPVPTSVTIPSPNPPVNPPPEAGPESATAARNVTAAQAAVSDVPPNPARDPFEPPFMLLETLRRQIEEQKKTETTPETELPAIPIEIPDLKLEGIFWGTKKPQAIINRTIVSVGDDIEEGKILAIERDGVTVSFGAQKVVLKPPPPIRSKETEGVSKKTGQSWANVPEMRR